MNYVNILLGRIMKFLSGFGTWAKSKRRRSHACGKRIFLLLLFLLGMSSSKHCHILINSICLTFLWFNFLHSASENQTITTLQLLIRANHDESKVMRRCQARVNEYGPLWLAENLSRDFTVTKCFAKAKKSQSFLRAVPYNQLHKIKG